MVIKEDHLKIIKTENIYPGFIGKEKWIIVSDHDEYQLEKEYKEYLDTYSPHIFITEEMWNAIHEYEKNEDKFRKRRETVLIEDLSDGIEDPLYESAVTIERRKYIRKGIESMKGEEKYILKEYFEKEKTIEQISRSKNVSRSTVHRKLNKAKDHMKKYIQDGGWI